MRSLLLASLIFFATQSYSQTAFDWYPNDTIETMIPSNDNTLLKIEQVNQTGGTLNLGIEVVYKDIPSGWDGMICVEGLCLGSVPDVGGTSPMNPISGSTNGYVRWTVNPMGGTESAKLRVRVYDLDNPTDGDTATWIVTSEPLGLEDLTQKGTFNLYPNPASEWINLNNTDQLDVLEFYSIHGKLVKQVQLSGSVQQTIYVNDLSEGLYFVNAISKGELIGTRKISIR